MINKIMPLFSRFKKNKKAFTILEMIIVLLVMGLITIAVISGASIVEQAGNRSVIGELKSIQENFYLFNVVYGGIPGDYATPNKIASTDASCVKGGTPAAVLGGDGNGQITFTAGYTVSGTTIVPEMQLVWCHLYLGNAPFGKFKLVNNTQDAVVGTNMPMSKSGRGGYTIFYSSSFTANIVQLYNNVTGSYDASQLANSAGALTTRQAYSILAKFDNGLANSGSVWMLNSKSGTGTGQCVLSTDASAVDTSSSGTCVLQYAIY